MTAYYNEFNEEAAEWLLELIAAGHIAPGDVDTRSIEDVRPDDLRGYTQCHFFAGIGVWSYALRRAGWSDDRPIWTGSCPCQPFSAAGQGAAFADERHLWPAFYHLIAQHVEWCRRAKRPIPEIVGEQVASKAVDDWIDLVHADMEAVDYAFGSIPFPSAGVGAPHIRDRNYWAGIHGAKRAAAGGLGDAYLARLEGHAGDGRPAGRKGSGRPTAAASLSSRMANADGRAGGQGCSDVRGWADGGDAQPRPGSGGSGVLGGLADADNAGRQLLARPQSEGVLDEALGAQRGVHESGSDGTGLGVGGPSPTNGYWRDADWLGCRDGKWRPVEPGTFPLVDGAPARVVRLRGYGNAINAAAAQAWIETVMEAL